MWDKKRVNETIYIYMHVCNVDVKRKAQRLASPYTRSLWLTTNDANASMYLHKRFVCNGVQSTARKNWTMLQSDVWTWHTFDRRLIICRFNMQFHYQSAHRRTIIVTEFSNRSPRIDQLLLWAMEALRRIMKSSARIVYTYVYSIYCTVRCLCSD